MKEKGKAASSNPYTKRLACANCRNSKLKCDRIKPCTSCNLRGLQDQCYEGDRWQGANQSIASNSYSVRDGESATTTPTDTSSFTLAEVNATLQGQQKAITSLLALVNGSSAELSKETGEQTWQHEVVRSLPSQKDCDVLLDFCFANLVFHSLLIDRRDMAECFGRLTRHLTVGRVEAAQLLVTLAAAAQMMPALHDSRSKLSCSPELEYPGWLLLADKIKSVHRVHNQLNSLDRASQFVMEITLDTLFAIYFSQSGRDDELWDVLGSAIRKGAVISLFDERQAIWSSLSESETIRRKKVALCLALMDGWAAFNRMRAPGVQFRYFHLSFEHETFQAGIPPLVGELDPRQLPAVPRCHDFVLDYVGKPPAARYAEADLLLDEVRTRTTDVLASMGINEPLEMLPSLIPTMREDQRVPLLACVSTSSYSACIMTRRFLTDPEAPAHLRFVSLQHAQTILATVPVCTAIMQEKRLPINPAWNANQLLCAASAFAVILIGRDEYLDKMALPFRHGSDEEIKNTPSSTSPVHLLEEQLDWLSTWIFEILDCLETIHTSNGNRTTLLCLKMLQGMCKVDKNLREAFNRRYKKPEQSWQHDAGASETDNSQEMLDLINLVWPDQEEASVVSGILHVRRGIEWTNFF